MDSIWNSKKFRYIPVHDIVKTIGPRKSSALSMFQDVIVSVFATRGKKSAWNTWMAYEQVTATFLALSTASDDINEKDIVVLSILLYECTNGLVYIDEARKQLFSKKGRAMDAIPPTRAALVQHIMRAVYQGGHCWGCCTKLSFTRAVGMD